MRPGHTSVTKPRYGSRRQWEGIDANGEGSLNNYSKGADVSFLHRYVAGLQIVEAGCGRFRVAPIPGGGITSARTVPEGTSAQVDLANGTSSVIGPGSHKRNWTVER